MALLAKRPDDGTVEPKHVALNVYLTIHWNCLTGKICTLMFSCVSKWLINDFSKVCAPHFLKFKAIKEEEA
jgi:hypothetical protein